MYGREKLHAVSFDEISVNLPAGDMMFYPATNVDEVLDAQEKRIRDLSYMLDADPRTCTSVSDENTQLRNRIEKLEKELARLKSPAVCHDLMEPVDG